MSTDEQVEALAEVVQRITDTFTGLDEIECRLVARTILASPAFRDLVAGERVAALREAADAWQWGAWTAITAKVKVGGPAAVIGAAQTVTDWLRERADRMTP